MSGERIPNEAIRAIREVLGLTQAEFGRPAGLSQSVIARLESGDMRTTSLHAKKLAEAYGRDPREFFIGGTSFSQDDDAHLSGRAALVARRLAGDNDSLMMLISGLAYAFLDMERRGQVVSDDEETLARIELVIKRWRQHYSR